MSILSELDVDLVKRTSNLIEKNLIKYNIETQDIWSNSDINLLSDDKFQVCLNIETIYYYYSTILTEIRNKKREITSSLFKKIPALLNEKSVLEKKLDADPEYAEIKMYEEYLFQFLEHLREVKSIITWQYKEEEDYNG